MEVAVVGILFEIQVQEDKVAVDKVPVVHLPVDLGEEGKILQVVAGILVDSLEEVLVNSLQVALVDTLEVDTLAVDTLAVVALAGTLEVHSQNLELVPVSHNTLVVHPVAGFQLLSDVDSFAAVDWKNFLLLLPCIN